MKTGLITLAMLVVAFLAYWLRTVSFREKKTDAPEETSPAVVIGKQIRSGNPHRSGRSHMGYTFPVTFRLADGRELELETYEVEYGALKEGMEGELTWKGRYFVSFEQDA